MTTFIFAMKHPPLLPLPPTARISIRAAIMDAKDAKAILEELGSRYHGMSEKVEKPIEHIENLIGRLERAMVD